MFRFLFREIKKGASFPYSGDSLICILLTAVVPGRGVQGGKHAGGDGLPTLLTHRPALRASRRLPQGY